MKISFTGDIHLGYKRGSFTTKEAIARYECAQIIQIQKSLAIEADLKIQCGDVFHKYQGTDLALANGLNTCSSYDVVLAANHDIDNTKTNHSTIDLCKDILGRSSSEVAIISPHKGEEDSGAVLELSDDDLVVFVIPHCYTQQQFELSVMKAQEHRRTKFSNYSKALLVLHTNYNLGFECTDTTNNLTFETAKMLVERSFDYVVSGHEHNYSEHFKGKLRMVGSVYPLSMAELESKYVLVYDTETHLMVKHRVWDAEKHCRSYHISDLPDELGQDIQFVTVTGESQADVVASAMKTLANWWKTSKSLLVCKPEFTVEGVSTAVEGLEVSKEDMVTSLRPLFKPEVVGIFDQLVKEVSDAADVGH